MFVCGEAVALCEKHSTLNKGGKHITRSHSPGQTLEQIVSLSLFLRTYRVNLSGSNQFIL